MTHELRTVPAHNEGMRDRARSRIRASLFRPLSIIFLLILILVILFYWSQGDISNTNHRVIWFSTGLTGLFVIWLIKEVVDLDWIKPPVFYAFIFWIFHLGLLFPASLSSIVLDTLPTWSVAWIFDSNTVVALLASLLFITSYGLGVIVVHHSDGEDPCDHDLVKSQELITVGFMVIAVGFLSAIIALFRFGVDVFLTNYQEFFEIHNSFSWPIVIIATGLMLQISGGQDNRTLAKTAMIFFLPLALTVFLAGSRTAPLFSLVAIISMLSFRGLRIPSLLLLIGAFIVLALTATVKDVRQEGLGAIVEQGGAVTASDPLSGLAELGSSLRPVSASIDYISNGQRLFYGETYLFPFIRQVERFTGQREATVTDERFIAQTIRSRYGAIGYSTVAEAFVNGGVLGIVLFAFGWGLILGWLSSNATTPYRLAILAVVMIPMLINVRNSFVYVPAWVLLGLMPVIAAKLLRNRNQNRASS